MSSTALSVSVTRSDAITSFVSSSAASYPRTEPTVLLRVHGRRVGRGYHLASLPGQVYEEVMDFLQIWVVHRGELRRLQRSLVRDYYFRTEAVLGLLL